ncbi:MAG: ABC transporter ATP-binding protein/permease [Lachnospiraceae bacterium]|nr:ABC transporter ATP-binding protein/permease [Lachnospiraceae bacterium]
MIPYVLEYMLDVVAPAEGNNMLKMILCGVLMIGIAIFVRTMNIAANRRAVKIASECIYNIREELFDRTMELSGSQVDKYGLPSLTSRMTSDSYNVQNFMRMIQTMGVRAPILLLGGMVVTMVMDFGLAMVLFILVPLIIVAVVVISRKGIPLYEKVQQKMDTIVRIMRENITGIRVVKALSKEEYETGRFESANKEMFSSDTTASVVMSLPGPIMTLIMNIGLTVVVVLGAYRVNGGITQPGVILAFLTYFNMILMGVNGVNRIFIMTSKANASASRIAAVIEEGQDLQTVYGEEYDDTNAGESGTKETKPYIAFENVNFKYMKQGNEADDYELTDISFKLEKGSSLGIIGATGSGKTTIINLLMRFYDATEGSVIVGGRDVREYKLTELRKKFGVVFQNDVIFADTLMENIAFGRDVDEKRAMEAVTEARAAEFVGEYEDGLNHKADIHGANMSGGQKQRILIARALAAKPEILVLDDSSSALDYKTDALLRQMIREHYNNTSTIIIAQRISSIMNLDNIIVMDDGHIVGQGTHEELMENCKQYSDIYEIQMN